ncbi:MAG: orotidine-5'-phosphate decarboxylase [bacterium]|nr:orotidine-5'-phosphate decarboxylase [bacterium]
MHVADRLKLQIEKRRSRVCVGLDINPEHLPENLLPPGDANNHRAITRAVDKFGKAIINAVAGEVAAVKFQSAWYESLGVRGYWILRNHIRLARKRGLFVISDAKRGDIGVTAKAYASAYLIPWDPTLQVDILTVSPYLGGDTLEPFIEACRRYERGVFVLVKTSNPGSADFQDKVLDDGRTLYQAVADRVAELGSGPGLSASCGFSAVGAVVGATYPEVVTELRERMPRALLLLPGVGAQGGDPAKLRAAFDDDGFGALVTSSRGIIFANKERGGDFAEAAYQAAIELNETVNSIM